MTLTPYFIKREPLVTVRIPGTAVMVTGIEGARAIMITPLSTNASPPFNHETFPVAVVSGLVAWAPKKEAASPSMLESIVHVGFEVAIATEEAEPAAPIEQPNMKMRQFDWDGVIPAAMEGLLVFSAFPEFWAFKNETVACPFIRYNTPPIRSGVSADTENVKVDAATSEESATL